MDSRNEHHRPTDRLKPRPPEQVFLDPTPPRENAWGASLRPVLLFACLAPLSVTAVQAGPEAEMEEVLSGFDEPAGKDAVDEVLEGFENGAPADASAEISSGFGETGAGTAPTAAGPGLPGWLGGALTLSSSWNYAHHAPRPGEADYRGLSRLRAKLALEVDHRFDNGWRLFSNGYGLYDLAYRINGRDGYPDQVLDDYESGLELGELYLQGELAPRLDLKLGRQIVIWGKSDNLRVTDILNPLDQRELGLVDIEDLRLPVGMAKLDYYLGDWNLSAMAIPEIRFHKNPPYGADFYPLPFQQPPEEHPADGGGNTELALAANGIFSGWDLSLYAARLFDDTPYRVATPQGPGLRHARLSMVGAAVNLALGNWLLKGELAHLRGVRWSGLPGREGDRTDLLLGLEYAGIANSSLSVELADRHTHGHDRTLGAAGVAEDDLQLAMRYQGDLLHDRLHLTAVTTRIGERLQGGGFSRFSVGYDLADALLLSGGLVLYHSGESLPFGEIADNDRLFVELEYNF